MHALAQVDAQGAAVLIIHTAKPMKFIGRNEGQVEEVLGEQSTCIRLRLEDWTDQAHSPTSPRGFHPVGQQLGRTIGM